MSEPVPPLPPAALRDPVRLPTAARFLVVGGASTVVTIGLFNLLVHAGRAPLLADRPVSAYLLTMAVGLAVNYAGNRFWAFGQAARGGLWSQVGAFLAANALAVAIPSVCLLISRYVIGLDSALADNVSANVVGLVLATLSRWWSYSLVVFKP